MARVTGRPLFALLQELTELPGPIGHEDAVQDWLVADWGTRTARVERTRVNNVVAHVGGSGPRLLIQAHADEICLMVKSISPDGFIHVAMWNAGSPDAPPRWLFAIGQPALVLGGHGPVPGLFATASGHVVSSRKREAKVFEWNDWFVDVGAASAAEVRELGIRPGCRAIWNPPTRYLGSGPRIYGKAMDDRGGLAIICALLDAIAVEDLTYILSVASTVQEETGLVGAASLIDHADFDLAIALDVGLCGDVPGVDRLDVSPALGAGPTIVYKDSGVHYSRRLSDHLLDLAAVHDIPAQPAIFQNFASDGEAFIRRGVDTALIAFPTRYTHSPFETVDERDLAHCVQLLAGFVTSAPCPERR
jgi:tetrahedral aminopeptidase